MTANYDDDAQDTTTSFLLRALTLTSALAVLVISVLLFSPAGQAEPASAKGVAYSTNLSANDRDNGQLEAFSKQEPYRVDYSNTGK